MTLDELFGLAPYSLPAKEKEKALSLGENAVNFYGFKNLTVPVKIKNMVED